jgi:hypothetical protein
MEVLEEFKNEFFIDNETFNNVIIDNIVLKDISYIFDDSVFDNYLKSKIKKALFNFYVTGTIHSIEF